jgi:hypothetical protein
MSAKPIDYKKSSKACMAIPRVTKSMVKFCFWVIKWNYFERKAANFNVESGPLDLPDTKAGMLKI